MAGSTTGKIRTAVRGLGEIALRVTNLDAMQKFYEEVIGLPLMTRVPNCAFFKIADGFGGHTQVLALFDRSQNPGYRGPDAATSTIDHIALEIRLANFADERKRLETLGLQVETTEHAWDRRLAPRGNRCSFRRRHPPRRTDRNWSRRIC